MLMVCISSLLSAQETRLPKTEMFETALQLYKKGLFQKSADLFAQLDTLNHDPHLVEAARYHRQKALGKVNPDQRRVYYRTFARQYPNSDWTDSLLMELGDIAYTNKQWQEAITYFDRSLEYRLSDRDAANRLYLKAEAYVALGKNDMARKTFLALADQFPTSEWSPKALYARGRLYLSENRYDASTRAFELLSSRYPNDPMTRRVGTALGESYYQQKQYEKAAQELKEQMPYLKGDLRAKAVYLIAESYNYLDRYDDASTYYLQYIRLKKGTDEVQRAHYGLGWIYHKQQIYHWAAREFNEAAIGENEMARKALYYQAVNLKLASRYEESLETFREFGERFEGGIWAERARYEWAITAFEFGLHTEAIEVLLPLARRQQELAKRGEVLTLLGESYFANREYTRALQTFEEAEKSTGIDPEIKRQARFQKAWVQYRNQAFKSAQPLFEQIYREDPDGKLAGEALFWSADSYYSYEDYGPAGAQFQKFVERFPEHELMGAALYSLGWSHFKMGRYQESVEPLQRFLNEYEAPPIALFPYDTDTQLRLGDAHYALGKYNKAIEYYNMAIGAEPGGDYAMFQVANSHYRADRSFEAVTTFRRLLRIYPFSRLREQAQYNIAYIYFLTGNYSQAIAEFKKVINKYPRTTWAARSQYNIGDAYYNAGDYQKAITEYDEVLDEYPRSDYIIDAVNGIQYAQLAAGMSDSSSVVLENFLQNHPRTSTADRLRFRQAENLLQVGDYDAAIKSFKQYLRVTNNESMIPEAYFSLADAYQQIGKTAQAMETYQVIIDNHPNSDQAATALAVLGRIYNDRGEYQKAQNYFEQLRDRGARYRSEALVGIANAELAQNQLTSAKQKFEEALALTGNRDAARLGLGKVALEQQRYQQAEAWFDEIANSNVTEIGAEAQYYLGLSLQRQQLYQQAIDAYSKMSVLYGAFEGYVARGMLKSAECYIQIKNRGQAINVLRDLVERYPDTPEAEQAEKLLETAN